jgi:hypothetical protein
MNSQQIENTLDQRLKIGNSQYHFVYPLKEIATNGVNSLYVKEPV